MPDVHIPGLGNMNRTTVIVAVVGGGGLGAYLWWKNKKNKKVPTDLTPGQYGYGQYGYGQYGYGQLEYSPYGYGYGPYGLGSYGSGAGAGNYFGYGYYGAGVGQVPSPVPQQASNNAQWSEAAVSALSAGGQGYTPVQVLASLGKYLTGATLNDTDVSVVQAAIASEGYPPVPGASGYPPQWHTAPTGGQTTKVTVPTVIGMTEDVAVRRLYDAGLHPHGAPIKKGTTGFVVKTQNPGAGTQVNSGTVVSIS